MRTQLKRHRRIGTALAASLALAVVLTASPAWAQSGLSMLCPANWFKSDPAQQVTYTPPAAPPATYCPPGVPANQVVLAPTAPMQSMTPIVQATAYAYPTPPQPAPTPVYTTQTVAYTPEVKYRWKYSPIPSTNVVPVQTTDACGNQATAYQTVTSYSLLPWLHREPYVTYKPTAVPMQGCLPDPCATCPTPVSGCTTCAPTTYGSVISSAPSDCATCAPTTFAQPADSGYVTRMPTPAEPSTPTPAEQPAASETQEQPSNSPIIGTSAVRGAGDFTKPLPPVGNVPKAIPDTQRGAAPQLFPQSQDPMASTQQNKSLEQRRQLLMAMQAHKASQMVAGRPTND